MRRFLPIVAAAVLLAANAMAGQYGSRTMSGWFNVRTQEGWTGRRYMDGEEIVAEEFDSNHDDRIDVWRFYRRGILSSEERDQNFDGKVDFVSHWESRNGLLMSAMRDTHQRGVFDIEVEYMGSNRWEVREDRNFDGITDRIIYVQAQPDLFDAMGVDMASQVDIASTVPIEYWTEMWADDGFTGSITDYFRYNRGLLTHHGSWDGRKILWAKVPPDYVPLSPTPATPSALRGQDQFARRNPQYYEPPPPGPAPIRDPFSMDADGFDPYAGIGPVNPESSPVWGAASSRQQSGGQYDQSYQGGRNYGTLPANESSAHAVPARMKAPGQATTAPERRSRRSR